jgi:hypothetical protein
LSPSEDEVEPLIGSDHEDEGEGESGDEQPVAPEAPAPVEPFDESPAMVMMLSLVHHPRQDIHCYHCNVTFHYVSEAITHFETSRHARTVAFMMGTPKYYCVICNRVPVRPFSHEMGPRHVRRRARLNLPYLPNQVALRQVRVCPRVRTRMAFLLP